MNKKKYKDAKLFLAWREYLFKRRKVYAVLFMLIIATFPVAYQDTSSTANSDFQKFDFCPYLKSTTAFPPSFTAICSILSLTSSKDFS